MKSQWNIFHSLYVGDVGCHMQTRTNSDRITSPFTWKPGLVCFVRDDVAPIDSSGDRYNSCVESHMRPQFEMRAVSLKILHILLSAEKVTMLGMSEVGESGELFGGHELQ